jgi:hypothetical protein
MPAHYVLTVKGEPGELLRAAFDDVAVSSGPGVTVLSAELDRPGLHGLLDRIAELGLELLDLRLVAETARSESPASEVVPRPGGQG